MSAAAGQQPFRAIAFGLRWHSDLPLTLFCPAPPEDAPPDITVRVRDDLPPGWTPPAPGATLRYLPGGFRYVHEDELAISCFPPGRVELHRGPGFRGTLPTPFFATVTALLLTLRQLLPLHGSAVELDGGATLICGPSGAGKSTHAARLIAGGGRLLSDDLSILHPGLPGEPPLLYAGRRTLRLHAPVAEALGRAVPWIAPPWTAAGKVAVLPPQVPPLQGVPLRTILLPGWSRGLVPQERRAALLAAQLFRPGRQAELPGHLHRLAELMRSLRAVPVEGLPDVPFLASHGQPHPFCDTV